MAGLGGLAGPGAASAEPVVLEVSQAVAGTDERSGRPVVSYVLTAAGRVAFAQFTAAHVGRKVDLRVDGQTVMTPVIKEPVAGGIGKIPVASTEAGRDLVRRLTVDGARLEIEAQE